MQTPLNVQDVLLESVASRRLIQRDIAEIYAKALAAPDAKYLDWPAMNRVIIERWSVSGLERVKAMAWRMFQEEDREDEPAYYMITGRPGLNRRYDSFGQAEWVRKHMRPHGDLGVQGFNANGKVCA